MINEHSSIALFRHRAANEKIVLRSVNIIFNLSSNQRELSNCSAAKLSIFLRINNHNARLFKYHASKLKMLNAEVKGSIDTYSTSRIIKTFTVLNVALTVHFQLIQVGYCASVCRQLLFLQLRMLCSCRWHQTRPFQWWCQTRRKRGRRVITAIQEYFRKYINNINIYIIF